MKCRTSDCNELAKYDGYCRFCIGRRWIACEENNCDQLTLPELGGKCFYHRAQRLLSIQDVAQMIGMCEKTVQRMTKEGRIPCTLTDGGHRRFKEEDIKKFLEDRHAQA